MEEKKQKKRISPTWEKEWRTQQLNNFRQSSSLARKRCCWGRGKRIILKITDSEQRVCVTKQEEWAARTMDGKKSREREMTGPVTRMSSQRNCHRADLFSSPIRAGSGNVMETHSTHRSDDGKPETTTFGVAFNYRDFFFVFRPVDAFHTTNWTLIFNSVRENFPTTKFPKVKILKNSFSSGEAWD